MSTREWFVLGLVFGFAGIHLLRDLLQELRIQTLLATMLTKDQHLQPDWYWKLFSSTIWFSLSLIFAVLAIYLNRFYPFGYLAIACELVFLVAWLFYWIKW